MIFIFQSNCGSVVNEIGREKKEGESEKSGRSRGRGSGSERVEENVLKLLNQSTLELHFVYGLLCG